MVDTQSKAWTLDYELAEDEAICAVMLDGDTMVADIGVIYQRVDGKWKPDTEASIERAEFIVRAANAHDALVAACEAAITAFHTWAEDESWASSLFEDFANKLDILDAALKLARGES